MNRMVILKADGSSSSIELTAPPKLDVLQKLVGGYIEAVPQFKIYDGQPCVAYCNEDGKSLGLPRNKAATGWWAYALGVPSAYMADVLVGDVVILAGDEAFMKSMST